MTATVPCTVEVGTVAAWPGASRPTRELARRHWRTTLTLGVLDEVARFAYTHGQCHALAAALAEVTGWPVLVHTIGRGASRYDDRFVEHCLVETPDGEWVDVLGAHDPAGWLEAHELGDGEVRATLRTDAAAARALATRAGMVGDEVPLLPANLTAARALIDDVLTGAGWQTR